MSQGRVREVVDTWAAALGSPRRLLVASQQPAVHQRIHRSFSWLLVGIIAAAALSDLVLAGWLGIHAGPLVAVHALLRFLQEALGATFLAYVVAWGVLWLTAPRGARGAAAISAYIVAMPVGFATIVHGLVLAVAPEGWGSHASWVKGMVAPLQLTGLVWALALLALAMVLQRRAWGASAVGLPIDRHRGGNTLLALVAVAAAAQVFQVWHRRDLLATAEQFDAVGALATVGDDGALGPPVAQAGGTTVKRGRAKVVEVWATWCGPCRASLPHVTAFATAHPELAIVLVNIDDPQRASQLIGALTPPLPGNAVSAFDTAQFAERLGASTLPTFAVYDEGGHLVDQWAGLDHARMARGVSPTPAR